MAEASWPSPNHGSPARSVTDTEYVRLAPWASDGVFQSASPPVYANSSGMLVRVRAGQYAIVRGHAWSSGTSDYSLTIAANSSGKTRVDTVVLRLDRSTWDVTAAVRQGTPGSGAPVLVRDTGDTGLWEIPLADVTVANGAASIAAGDVKSRTLYQSGAVRVCGLITEIQSTLLAGDIVYEMQTGRWIGWTGVTGTLLFYDTGWVSVPVTGHWKAGGFPPQVRRQGSVVYLRGSIQRITDTLQHEGLESSPVANLTSEFIPVGTHNWAAVTSAVSPVRLQATYQGLVHLVDAAADVTVGRAVYIDTVWMVG
jgi:hypothetical protein